MNDPVATIAHATAERLGPDRTPTLSQDVDVALLARDGQRPETYIVDPVSLGSLVVSVASLAWTVYSDLRGRAPRPARDVVARAVRVRLHDAGATDSPDHDRIIEIVVDETVRAGAQL